MGWPWCCPTVRHSPQISCRSWMQYMFRGCLWCSWQEGSRGSLSLWYWDNRRMNRHGRLMNAKWNSKVLPSLQSDSLLLSQWWPAEIHWWAELLHQPGTAPPHCDSWGILEASGVDARWSSWLTPGASCPGRSCRRCVNTAVLVGQRTGSSTRNTSGLPLGCPWWRLEYRLTPMGLGRRRQQDGWKAACCTCSPNILWLSEAVLCNLVTTGTGCGFELRDSKSILMLSFWHEPFSKLIRKNILLLQP